MTESFSFPFQIPENSDSFKDWQRRRDAGIEVEPAVSPTIDFEFTEPRVQIPENSDSFKDWQHTHPTEESQ